MDFLFKDLVFTPYLQIHCSSLHGASRIHQTRQYYVKSRPIINENASRNVLRQADSYKNNQRKVSFIKHILAFMQSKRYINTH